jgi:hypothetical protein
MRILRPIIAVCICYREFKAQNHKLCSELQQTEGVLVQGVPLPTKPGSSLTLWRRNFRLSFSTFCI